MEKHFCIDDAVRHVLTGEVYIVKKNRCNDQGEYEYDLCTRSEPKKQLTLPQDELEQKFFLLPFCDEDEDEETPSAPHFFTGKIGSDHWQAATAGRDFVLIKVQDDWLLTTDKSDSEMEYMLGSLEYDYMLRVRALNADDALANVAAAEAQYAAFFDGKSDWYDAKTKAKKTEEDKEEEYRP